MYIHFVTKETADSTLIGNRALLFGGMLWEQ